MATLLICMCILVLIIIISISLVLATLSKPKKNWPGAPYPYASRDPETGFPYKPSKEFLEKYKEEQRFRQKIVREHGIGALNSYLDIMNPRNKQ